MADTDDVQSRPKKNRPKKHNKSGEMIPLTENVRQNSKPAIDDLLRQAVQENSSNKKSRKKKKTDESMLEILRNGEGLQKDQDDTTRIANTFDPNSLKKSKSNKQRQLEQEKKGNINEAYEETEFIETEKKKKRSPKKDISGSPRIDSPNSKKSARKKSPKSPSRHSDGDVLSDDNVSPKKKSPKSPSRHSDGDVLSDGNVSPKSRKPKRERKPRKNRNNSADPHDRYDTFSDDMLDSEERPKRRKVKKRIPKESDTDFGISSNLSQDSLDIKKRKKKTLRKDITQESELYEDNEDDTREDEVVTDSPRKHTKKKTKKKVMLDHEQEEQEERPVTPPVIEDDGRIAGVTIHRTDKLKTDFYIAHPVVRIHVIDVLTGKNVKKQNKERAVTSFYEGENESLDFILPIITQPYDFKKFRSTIPMWEETVIFNENFNYLIAEEPNVVMFFEILDFVSMNTASERYSRAKREGGWHRIAWAFLKLVGKNNMLNTGKKSRLQLYHPPKSFNNKSDLPEVFQWWKSNNRSLYPSTIYVTVKGIFPPDKMNPAMRSMFATQAEKSGKTFEDLTDTVDASSKLSAAGKRRAPTQWTRLAGQVCKVPNEPFLILSGGRSGSSFIKFSPDGRMLACGSREQGSYPISLYEIPTGLFRGKFPGHSNLVYDICWSPDSKQILSASGDGTARVWDAEKPNTKEIKMMPHPSFVYASKFHIRVSKIIVTGCFDQVVRVWSMQGDDYYAQLMQELDGHVSYINSLCFDEDGSKMYSADGLGTIKVWNVYVTDQPSKRGSLNYNFMKHHGLLKDWTLNKDIIDPEIKGSSINHIQSHPNGKRLLVHTRDNTIRMIDIRIGSIMQRFQGALNYQEKISSCITPCGTFVVSGSEDQIVYYWNADTGDQVAMFPELKFKSTVRCVEYHPHDHMMALCAYGEYEPVVVFRYSHLVARQELGLKVESADEVQVISRRGRPGAPKLMTHTEEEAADEGVERTRERFSSTRDGNRTDDLARLDRVRKKLESVTSPNPSTFSPHASVSLMQSLRNQAQLGQADYLNQATGSWRPAFSPVGSLRASTGKSPMVSLNMVIALYDYQAQRSDELNLERGDMIKVLHKDNDNWWMGEIQDGQQGYFPANYVEPVDSDHMDQLETKQGEKKKTKVPDPDGDDGADLDIQEVIEEVPKRKTAAVLSKNGDLKFISGSESETEESTHEPPQVKKKQRKERPKMTIENEELPKSNQARKKKKVPKNESEA